MDEFTERNRQVSVSTVAERQSTIGHGSFSLPFCPNSAY
jgi:hypothetical protein